MPASKVKLRSIDDVCRRAIAALLTTQTAIMLDAAEHEEVDFFIGLMEHFGVSDCLNRLERSIVDAACSEQDITNAVWEYECYWSLVWALGLIDDITDASDICDCPKAIQLVSQCEGFEDFKSRCSMRSADEIMDMYDLYKRYQWAVFKAEHISGSSAGSLDDETVCERLRGLAWLISDTEDWHDISLDL